MLVKNSNLEKLRTMLSGEFAQRLTQLQGIDNYSSLVTIINSNS